MGFQVEHNKVLLDVLGCFPSESDGFHTGRLVSVHERHEADKDVSHDVCVTTVDRLSLRPAAAVIADVLVNTTLYLFYSRPTRCSRLLNDALHPQKYSLTNQLTEFRCSNKSSREISSPLNISQLLVGL